MYFREICCGNYSELSNDILNRMEAEGLSNDMLVSLYEDRERYVALAFRYLGDKEKARDIFSECFAYVFGRRGELSGDLPGMKAYLMRTVKCRCLDELRLDTARKASLKSLYEADAELLAEDTVSGKVARLDLNRMLDAAGMRMDKLTFDVYVSSRLGGFPHKDIARMYGITQNRVAKEIMKANRIFLKIVREYLHVIVFFIQYLCFFINDGHA